MSDPNPSPQNSQQTADGSASGRALALAILALSALAVCLWPESLPGLHGDEAWVLAKAESIQRGQRPLAGMNYYTGALYPYFVALVTSVAGPPLEAMRVATGLLNVAALWILGQLVRRIHPHDNTWLWMLLLVASSPPFVLFARFATEITALTPVLLFGGLLAIRHGWSHATRKSKIGSIVAGGGLLGLAVYNHMAAAGTVAAIGLGLLVLRGARGLLDRRLHWAALGVLVGVAPRLVQIANLPTTKQGPLGKLVENFGSGPVADLWHVPRVFAGIVDGELLFQRFAGGVEVWVFPTFVVAALVLLALRGLQRKLSWSRADAAIVSAFVAALVFTTLIAPGLALRYFAAPALVAPYFLVRLAQAGREQAKYPSWRRPCTLLLASVASLHAAYVAVDYFYVHRVTGGQLSVFRLGTRLLETSNHFVRSDRLYEQLRQRGIRAVFADNLIRWPLDYYDRDNHALSTAELWQLDRINVPQQGSSAIVAYNGPTAVASGELVDLRERHELHIGTQRFARATGFDDHYLVWIHEPTLP